MIGNKIPFKETNKEESKIKKVTKTPIEPTKDMFRLIILYEYFDAIIFSRMKLRAKNVGIDKIEAPNMVAKSIGRNSIRFDKESPLR